MIEETEAERDNRTIFRALSSCNYWYGIGCLVGMGFFTVDESECEFGSPPTYAAALQWQAGFRFQRFHNG